MDSTTPAPKAKAPKETKVESITPTTESTEMSHDKESKQSIKFEGTAYPAALEKYLQSLASGFSGGSLVITAGDRTMTLEPQGEIEFELKAKRKDDESEIVLKLSWNEPEPTLALPVETLVIEARKGH